MAIYGYNEFYGTGTATTTGGLGGLTGNLSTRSNTGNAGKYIFVNLGL